jgi:class 3 adenylate cyclase
LRRVLTLYLTAGRLRDFSEWSMGRDLVARAVADSSVLKLKRESRAVLFMDIRGFTRWTEPRPPEAVVQMLDAYFAAAEAVWSRFDPVIARLIADEVMLVVPDLRTGLRLAARLRDDTLRTLEPFGLTVGIGINEGTLMEGLIGSPTIRAYDIIGDTANTASRLCSAAAPGEILVPEPQALACKTFAVFGPARMIEAKGKRDPLAVRSLDRLIED